MFVKKTKRDLCKNFLPGLKKAYSYNHQSPPKTQKRPF